MIINSNNTSVENTTSMQVNSFSLANTAHIFKVLYSSMYENKEKAVLRELSSNALDGHQRIGKESVPIVIQLPTPDLPELVVTDGGIGMSHEELTTIYPVHGVSTKRDSNDQIGGFGYGSKSPFAISDSFTVKSTKDGVTTHMSCFLDEGTPKFVVFSSKETGDSSGTVITVPVANELTQQHLVKVAETLFDFWPVKPKLLNNTSSKTATRITVEPRDTNYCIVKHPRYSDPYGNSIIVTIGPFAYRLPSNIESIVRECYAYKTLLKLAKVDHNTTQRVTPTIPIGILELAPSREYIEDTNDNLKKVIAIYEAILRSIKDSLQVDPDTFVSEYYDFIRSEGIFADKLNSDNVPELVYVDPSKLDRFLSKHCKTTSTLALSMIDSLYITDENYLLNALEKGKPVALKRAEVPTSNVFFNLAVPAYFKKSTVLTSSTEEYITPSNGYSFSGLVYVFPILRVKEACSSNVLKAILYNTNYQLYGYSLTRTNALKKTIVSRYLSYIDDVRYIVFNKSSSTTKVKEYVTSKEIDVRTVLDVECSEKDVDHITTLLKKHEDITGKITVITDEDINTAWANRKKPVRVANSTPKVKAQRKSIPCGTFTDLSVTTKITVDDLLDPNFLSSTDLVCLAQSKSTPNQTVKQIAEKAGVTLAIIDIPASRLKLVSVQKALDQFMANRKVVTVTDNMYYIRTWLPALMSIKPTAKIVLEELTHCAILNNFPYSNWLLNPSAKQASKSDNRHFYNHCGVIPDIVFNTTPKQELLFSGLNSIGLKATDNINEYVTKQELALMEKALKLFKSKCEKTVAETIKKTIEKHKKETV